MDEVKVNYHKTQIDLMSFEIDLLDDSSKIEVIKHLEETLSLLKIGSRDLLSPKKIKLDYEAITQTEEVIQEEAIKREPVKTKSLIQSSVPPIVDEDAIRAMYEGLIPTCNECGAKFPSLGALDNHSKLHDEHNLSPAVTPKNVKVKTENASKSNDFTCTECGKYCFSKKNLLRHRVIHTDKYQCNTCGKSCYDSTDLASHNKSEDNCMRYMNTLMNQTVKTESEDQVQDHVENEPELNTTEEEDDANFEPSIDEEMLESSFNETEDVTMEEAINDEYLEDSLAEFPEAMSENEVTEASQIQTTIDKRQCPTCLHKFSSMSRIRYHQQNPENCKKFLTKESSPKASEHNALQESNEELSTVSTEAECEEDNIENHPNENVGSDEMEAEESSNMDEHHVTDSSSQDESNEEEANITSVNAESSSNVKSFTCRICQKMFAANNTLITHMNVHSDKFVCQLCQHRFSTQRQLLKHNKDPSNCRKYLDKKSKTNRENTKMMEEIEPFEKIEDGMKHDDFIENETSLDEQSYAEDDIRNEEYADNDLFDSNSYDDEEYSNGQNTATTKVPLEEGSEVPVDKPEKIETETNSSSNSNKLQCPVCLHNFSSLVRLRGHMENPQKCKRFLKKLRAKTLETENFDSQDQTLEETTELLNQEDKRISFEEEIESKENNENTFPETKDVPKEKLDQSGVVEESGLKKKERKKCKVIICEICSIEINFGLKKYHEKGLVHQEMLIQKCLGISKGLKDPFICRVCNKSLANPKVFHNHLARVCKRKSIDKEQKEKGENVLEETEIAKQSETSFNCLECEDVLTSNEGFASHMRIHEEEADMDTSEDNISEENVQRV